MATNAIFHCGLTSNNVVVTNKVIKCLCAYVLVIVVNLIVDITGNLDEMISLL